MKKLSREEMKNLIGGVRASSVGWCQATFTCANGSSMSITCENAEAGCVGEDYVEGTSVGKGYCSQNGELDMVVCSTAA
jgi:hypothetical protein